jgi:hypothetical protein
VGVSSIKQNDFLVHNFAADRALSDLVCAQLARPMSTEEHAVLAPVHAHLTLCLQNIAQGINACMGTSNNFNVSAISTC